jgi:hypothetical protein
MLRVRTEIGALNSMVGPSRCKLAGAGCNCATLVVTQLQHTRHATINRVTLTSYHNPMGARGLPTIDSALERRIDLKSAKNAQPFGDDDRINWCDAGFKVCSCHS